MDCRVIFNNGVCWLMFFVSLHSFKRGEMQYSHFTHAVVIAMLSGNEKGPKNILCPFHTGMYAFTFSSWDSRRVLQRGMEQFRIQYFDQNCSKPKLSVQSSDVCRQWFQECGCAVAAASLNPQVEQHSFSDYCLCSQHGQTKPLSVKHPEMFCNSASD